MKKETSRLKIGKIGKSHGIKGELRITPLTDFPDRFHGMKQVYVDDEIKKIKSVRYQNNQILIAFDGYDTREAAAALTGKYLLVDRADAVPLEEGEYYIDDIIGLDVYEEDSADLLGVVTDVISTGSNDVYIVKPADSQKREILVPALKAVVKKISLADGTMLVKLPEELD